MEIAKLLLEYIRVLIWPAVIVILIIKYGPIISQILQQVRRRIGQAETIKVGVAGQSLELSGTAKQIIRETVESLSVGVQSSEQQISTVVERIEETITKFSDPLTDLVGFFLLENPDHKFPVEDISIRVFYSITDDEEPTSFPWTQPWILGRFEAMLKELIQHELVRKTGKLYSLTDKGIDFFEQLLIKAPSYAKLERLRIH